MGNTCTDLGEPRRAIEHHRQHLEIERGMRHQHGEAIALGNLGVAFAKLGDPERAIECFEQQLVIMRELGDRGGEGKALGNLGAAWSDLGKPHAVKS
jgi:tetratricopeptide (TPR) repeat protein